MSLVFSDTTLKNGIIQGIERELFGDDGDGKISGNAVRLARFTADINLALNEAWAMILTASGKWNWDDNNHGDHPIVRANLVSGQRDYAFTLDGSGNTILEFFKVFVKDTNGVYHEIDPVDVQSGNKWELGGFTDGLNAAGIPSVYDKTGNSVFLDPIPNYNSVAGLMVYVSREGHYFTVADTTRKPGFAGTFHEYLVMNPAYKYARRNSLADAESKGAEMLRIEKAMKAYYGRRAKDEPSRLSGRITPFK